jgi:hypothetical protein
MALSIFNNSKYVTNYFLANRSTIKLKACIQRQRMQGI